MTQISIFIFNLKQNHVWEKCDLKQAFYIWGPCKKCIIGSKIKAILLSFLLKSFKTSNIILTMKNSAYGRQSIN